MRSQRHSSYPLRKSLGPRASAAGVNDTPASHSADNWLQPLRGSARPNDKQPARREQMKAPIATWLLPTILLLTLTSPLVLADDGDISKVNGSIKVESGRSVGDVETVNGSITIEDSVKAGNVETVSGGVRIGRDSTVGSVESVNGGISLDAGARSRSIEVVNGGVDLKERSHVDGSITSVNGG